MDSYTGASRSAAEPTAPTLFSMSRGILENKRMNINANAPEPQASARLSDMPPRRFLSSAAPRISVDALIPNPARTSTPVVPRARMAYSNQNEREQEAENEFSSPSFNSPPKRAYMRSSQQRNSAVEHTFRLSELGRPSEPQQKPSSRTQTDGSSSGSHLLASLNATVADNERLQSEKEQLNVTIQQLTRDLNTCHSRLEASTAQLEQSEAELKTTRPLVASTREHLVSKEAELAVLKETLQETKSALEKCVAEAADVREAHTNERLENERLRTSVDTAKNSIAKLFVELRTIGDNRRELKKLYDALSVRYGELSKEAEQLRTMAKDGLAALEPMLDDDKTLTRAAETKALLHDLQAEVTASHEVTDFLRNKLQVQGCQLAEQQRRIRELEGENHGVMREMLEAQKDDNAHRKGLEALHAEYEDLSQRLSQREVETVDLLASAASTAAELKVAREEIDMHQRNFEAQRSELESLRVMKEEHVSRLLALQETINSRDKDIVALKGEVKAAQESKADLRALLTEAKKTLVEKEAELRAKDPNDGYLTKIGELEKERAALKAALEDSQEERILFERATKTLQAETEKKVAGLSTTNTELLTHNKLLQESLVKAQDELKDSISHLHHLQAELARAKELYDSIGGENTELKKRLETQSVGLFQTKEEISALKERIVAASESKGEWQKTLNERNAQIKSLEAQIKEQGEAVVQLQEDCSVLKGRATLVQEQQRKDESLIKSNEKRALAAETSLELARRHLLDANSTIANLKEESLHQGETIASLRSTLVESANKGAHDADARVTTLEERLAALILENTELSNRADQLPNRYKDGKLSVKEKEFIRHIMEDASRIHDEDNVKKDHEMRRRDLLIQSLNEKNAELQAAVARLLKEKNTLLGEAQKSLINPKAWLSSSPEPLLQESPEGTSERIEAQPPWAPVDDPSGKAQTSHEISANANDSEYASELTDFDENEDNTKGKPRKGPSTGKNKRARSPTDIQPDDDQKQPKKRNARGFG
ncbi:hypothetical protein D9619_006855 [Psilocybe cf. subviscida]|uniref:Uncharacterized protein n=1 Tax=Psilocybe cf. subviscida TaxID=2480587 RepID=A0A8H5B426_9AGAR|nr:hypothetical protein D9619_006855 [Psilocybe cf. subviscida]